MIRLHFSSCILLWDSVLHILLVQLSVLSEIAIDSSIICRCGKELPIWMVYLQLRRFLCWSPIVVLFHFSISNPSSSHLIYKICSINYVKHINFCFSLMNSSTLFIVTTRKMIILKYDILEHTKGQHLTYYVSVESDTIDFFYFFWCCCRTTNIFFSDSFLNKQYDNYIKAVYVL